MIFVGLKICILIYALHISAVQKKCYYLPPKFRFQYPVKLEKEIAVKRHLGN